MAESYTAVRTLSSVDLCSLSPSPDHNTRVRTRCQPSFRALWICYNPRLMLSPRVLALAAGAVLLAGCASTQATTELAAVEATEAQVADCEFLGTVSGRARKPSLIGGGKARREAAFSKVADETDALGGTHFVIDSVDARNSWHVACGFACGDRLDVIAKAYRCEESEPEA